MWLSQQRRDLTRRENTVETGPVTLSGDPAGVYLSGERRSVSVYSPGGYQWAPAPGQEVLVLKAGADGESPCTVGARQKDTPQPGEVRLSSADQRVQIHLTQNGRLELRGSLIINGLQLTELIRQIVQSILGEPDDEGGMTR